MTERPLLVQIVGDLKGFLELRAAWSALVDRLPWATVFSTWEWSYCWWEAFSSRSRLAILAFWGDNGELVALLPLYRECVFKYGIPMEVARLIGSGVGGTEYLDILVAPGSHGVVSRALRGVWRGTLDDVDLFDFRDLRGGGYLKRILAKTAPALRTLRDAPQTVNPGLTLPARVEDLERLGDRRRRSAVKDILRRERALRARVELSCEVLTHPDEVGQGFAVLVRLHQELWRARSQDGVFSSEAMRRFKERLTVEMARRGSARLFLLRADGRPVAALLGYRMGDTFCYFQSGNDPEWRAHGVGKLLVYRVIARSIEEGAAQFDFLRGDEPYKFDFADMTRSSAVLTLVRDSARTRLFRGAEQCRDLLQRVYRLCRRRRIRSAATAAGGAL